MKKKPILSFGMQENLCLFLVMSVGKTSIKPFAVQTRKQEIIEERIAFIERTEVRDRLKESEKRLSQNIYERGVDDSGFARIAQ